MFFHPEGFFSWPSGWKVTRMTDNLHQIKRQTMVVWLLQNTDIGWKGCVEDDSHVISDSTFGILKEQLPKMDVHTQYSTAKDLMKVLHSVWTHCSCRLTIFFFFVVAASFLTFATILFEDAFSPSIYFPCTWPHRTSELTTLFSAKIWGSLVENDQLFHLSISVSIIESLKHSWLLAGTKIQVCSKRKWYCIFMLMTS